MGPIHDLCRHLEQGVEDPFSLSLVLFLLLALSFRELRRIKERNSFRLKKAL